MRESFESITPEETIAKLREKIEYLESHPSIAAGMQGEKLILDCIGGELTEYAAPYDLELVGGIRIEIKRSRLGPVSKKAPNTLRWAWSNLLGSSSKGKRYDYLLLIGDRDYRYKSCYLVDAPYVFFLIPMARVPQVVGKNRRNTQIHLTTNFRTVRSERGLIIIDHMVRSSLADAIEKMVARSIAIRRIHRTPLANRKRGGTVKRINRTPLAKH